MTDGGLLLGTVLPGSAPVRCPGHLVHAGCALNTFDPQAWPECPGVKVEDEPVEDYLSETLALLTGQAFVILRKSGSHGKRWHE
jgi:hypothetical protein